MSQPTGPSNRPNVISALLAGFIAGFIWMAITVLLGTFNAAAIVGGGVGFVVGTVIVAFIITVAVSRSRTRA